MPSLYRGFKQAVGFALGIVFVLVILGNFSATKNFDSSNLAPKSTLSHEKQLNGFLDSISRKVNDMEHKIESINDLRNMLEDLKEQNGKNQNFNIGAGKIFKSQESDDYDDDYDYGEEEQGPPMPYNDTILTSIQFIDNNQNVDRELSTEDQTTDYQEIYSSEPTQAPSPSIESPWDKYRSESWESVAYWNGPAPNPTFVFHNKLPKAGSSTMNNILKLLKKRNLFTYKKLEPTELTGDTYAKETPTAEWIRQNWSDLNNTSDVHFLLKHHFPFDFQRHGFQQPTYINVMRDPIDWFQSHYYFERFGWQQVNADRGFKGTDEERDMIIDDCVKTRYKQCQNFSKLE